MKAFTFLKIITVLNVLVSTGFATAGIVNPFLLLPANTTYHRNDTICCNISGSVEEKGRCIRPRYPFLLEVYNAGFRW